MNWFRLDVGFRRHPRVYALAAALGATRALTLDLLLGLFDGVASCAEHGGLAGVPAEVIADWTGWRGDHETLLAALRFTGWIDADGTLHGWSKRQAPLVTARNAKRDWRLRQREARATGEVIHRLSTGGNPPEESPRIPTDRPTDPYSSNANVNSGGGSIDGKGSSHARAHDEVRFASPTTAAAAAAAASPKEETDENDPARRCAAEGAGAALLAAMPELAQHPDVAAFQATLADRYPGVALPEVCRLAVAHWRASARKNPLAYAVRALTSGSLSVPALDQRRGARRPRDDEAPKRGGAVPLGELLGTAETELLGGRP